MKAIQGRGKESVREKNVSVKIHVNKYIHTRYASMRVCIYENIETRRDRNTTHLHPTCIHTYTYIYRPIVSHDKISPEPRWDSSRGLDVPGFIVWDLD